MVLDLNHHKFEATSNDPIKIQLTNNNTTNNKTSYYKIVCTRPSRYYCINFEDFYFCGCMKCYHQMNI